MARWEPFFTFLLKHLENCYAKVLLVVYVFTVYRCILLYTVQIWSDYFCFGLVFQCIGFERKQQPCFYTNIKLHLKNHATGNVLNGSHFGKMQISQLVRTICLSLGQNFLLLHVFLLVAFSALGSHQLFTSCKYSANVMLAYLKSFILLLTLDKSMLKSCWNPLNLMCSFSVILQTPHCLPACQLLLICSWH